MKVKNWITGIALDHTLSVREEGFEECDGGHRCQQMAHVVSLPAAHDMCDGRHISLLATPSKLNGRSFIAEKEFLMAMAYNFQIIENCLKCVLREQRLFCDLPR